MLKYFFLSIGVFLYSINPLVLINDWFYSIFVLNRLLFNQVYRFKIRDKLNDI